MEDYKVTKMPSPIDILLISFIQFFLHRGGTMEVGVGWGEGINLQTTETFADYISQKGKVQSKAGIYISMDIWTLFGIKDITLPFSPYPFISLLKNLIQKQNIIFTPPFSFPFLQSKRYLE